MNNPILKKLVLCLLLSTLYSLLFTDAAFAMHISEGILPLPWAGLWFLVALPFLIKGIFDIKKRAKENSSFKPLLGLMAAVVFVISCMPVPVPTAGTCSHPAGTGISAILVGPVMSIFVTSIALFIQALFLAHGGFTTWGADIVSMGVGGSLAAYFAFKILRRLKAPLFFSGFVAGILADWVTYIITSFELASALHGSKPFLPLFTTILVAFIPTQLPLGILEGFLTAGMIVFVSKRRPDILSQLSVVSFQPSVKRKMKEKIKILLFTFLAVSSLLLAGSRKLLADSWPGVDVSVVEKVAEEHGRSAWTPFINTDQGDLLLFVFLLAGISGGFVLGYCWRKLFVEKDDLKHDKRDIQR
ncbi:MAG: cobalamin biosynthesis protein CbiM [Omnitrophica WOR_2 bacterium GWF2_43_52]|nr:MAG: cobalamin biosynthesis protein CbiM [Omnitrophica WOR_2 bacterium GWC2_44_8]OGX22385.1 MAG: cobalamin biosynthesis protein CbiM [Omnitrophica WOR_2 bacterium GWF2_43_52]OGX57868.1 MAG: cobalamin biosynthesis protein CbiM [Omnitrophica WOR_2 bacterium RIFOXYC2_FULL_43_9]HAH20801.1 energy-coupling factor ABC transporter permease [Candidatus Omnitrophota bacterium]HBG64469.1 energy-coupling factor ABC transporter permease [Candidatus Omnitrophota bacterium]